MGKKAGAFLTGAIIGGTDAFIKLKGQQMADDRQDARDKLLRDSIAGKALVASPLGQVGDKLLDGVTKDKATESAPGFSGTQAPAPIENATPKPVEAPKLNAIEQANADHTEMADQFKSITSATGG